MERHQTSLTAPERYVRTAAEPWHTTLLGVSQIASESIFNSMTTTAASRFAPALNVPEHFLVQLLHIEDRRFLLHPGVDPLAIVRAVVANSTRSGAIQGASTITQQVHTIRWHAKGVRRRGLLNKAFQAAWALAEETRRSKFDILKEYLSTVYWGLSYHGIDEAASGYFRTTRERLTVAQSFFLVERLASPDSVLPGRIQSLLQWKSISEILLRNPKTHEEIVALYNEHLRCGDNLHNLLISTGA